VQHLDEEKPEGAENESIEQVAFADRILLNKCDLVERDEIDLVKARLLAINKFTDIVETQQSEIDIDKVLGIKKFDLGRVVDMDDQFLNSIGDHVHDDRISSVGIQFEGAIDMPKLNAWLSRLLATKGADIFRSKGVLNVQGSEDRFAFQGVHMLMGFTSSANGSMAPWKEDEVRTNKFVFIGRNLNREQLESNFKACVA